MRTGGMLMDACLFVHSVVFSIVHQKNRLLKREYLLLVQRSNINTMLANDKMSAYIRIILDFEVGLSRSQEIIDAFVVDLQVGNPDVIVVAFPILKLIKFDKYLQL